MAPSVFLVSPAMNLSFNAVVDFNFLVSDNNSIFSCVLRIDGVDRNSWLRIDSNTYNVIKYNITSLSEGVHVWDVNCLDYNSNSGTYAGTVWNIIYDIIAGRNAYFSTQSDFNTSANWNALTINPTIKPMGQMDWNVNDIGAELSSSSPLFDSNLIGLWHLNGNANDSTLSGNNGTINGATSTTGLWGTNTLSFVRNSSQYVLIGDPVPTNLRVQNQITLSAWIYPTSCPTNDLAMIIGSQYDSSGVNGVTIFYDGRTSPDSQTSPACHIHFQIGMDHLGTLQMSMLLCQ